MIVQQTTPRFQPGDFVVVRAQALAAALVRSRRAPEKDWMGGEKVGTLIGQVVEIVEQTCCAGMQRHYTIRLCGASGIDPSTSNFLEIELDHAPAVHDIKEEDPKD